MIFSGLGDHCLAHRSVVAKSAGHRFDPCTAHQLNQRFRSSTLAPRSGKTCFKPVSGNWAAEFFCILTAGFEFFGPTTPPSASRKNCPLSVSDHRSLGIHSSFSQLAQHPSDSGEQWLQPLDASTLCDEERVIIRNVNLALAVFED